VAEGERVEAVVRACDDDARDIGTVDEQLNGPAEHGTATEVFIELVPVAVAGRFASGGDDDAGTYLFHHPIVPLAYDASVSTPDDVPESDGPAYLAPYRRAVRTFGPSFEATLWASKPKQTGRFAVIASMMDLAGKRIVDAGCGLGDLAGFMREAGIDYESYVGLEAVEEMARAGAERGYERARFEAVDFAERAGGRDEVFAPFEPGVVVFSGSLNTFTFAEAEAVLAAAWSAASHGIVFNFLSARHHRTNAPDPSPARRWEPGDALAWALARTPRVLFRQDYFDGHDAAVAMIKRDAPGFEPIA
jgi:SAM-dependent methyltransferase